MKKLESYIIIFLLLGTFSSHALQKQNNLSLPKYLPNEVEAIIAELNRTGVAIVKGAIPIEKISQYGEKVQRFFSYMDAKAAAVTDQESGFAANVARCFKTQGGFSLSLAMDEHFETPRGLQQIFIMIKEAGLLKVAKQFLGGNVGFLVDGSSARRQAPEAPEKALPLHQDGGVLGNQKEGLVFWVPLTPIDESTPGLEVVPKKVSEIFTHTSDPRSGFTVLADPETVLKKYEKDIVAPQLELGDLLIFTLPTLHRSNVHAAMNKVRYSLDLRCVNSNAMPTNYVGSYLMLEYDIVGKR